MSLKKKSESQTETHQEQNKQFQLLKLYVKDASFRLPESVHIFQQAWNPELYVKIAVEPTSLAEANTYEVVLTVGTEVKTKEKVAFTSEIQQAGIFTISALPEEELRYTLHAFCPNLLYMYARELLADFVQKAGFPQLNLAPVDFELMHQQELKKKLSETA